MLIKPGREKRLIKSFDSELISSYGDDRAVRDV